METPFLFPINPDDFFTKIREIIDETIHKRINEQIIHIRPTPDGLISNPILSLKEVCTLFKISKPTVYEWISHKKLKPFKIRGKVYFLQAHIQSLFEEVDPS